MLPGARQVALGALLVLVAVAVVAAAVALTGTYPSAAIGRLSPSAQAESGRVVTRHRTSALSVGWSADSTRVISSAMDSPIHASRIADGADAAAEGSASLLAVAPAANVLAAASGDSVVVRGLEDWQPRLTLGSANRPGAAADRTIASLAISADGTTVAARSFDGLATVWRVADGSRIGMYGDLVSGTGSQVNGVALSGDGRWLASISRGVVRVWDLTTHKDAVDVGEPAFPLQSAAISPDGRTVPAGLGNGVVRLSAVDGSTSRDLPGQTGAVSSVGFSADGALLVAAATPGSAGSEGSVRIWHTGDGSAVGTLPYPGQATVMSLAFAPDGQHLAGALSDGTVRVWTLP